jgi:outer membrane protein OmpA-like peptidoglycan-associated protein
MLAGAAVGALMTGTAQAQVQSGPGFFGYVDGMYLLPAGPGPALAATPGIGAKSRHGDGWGIEGKLGYSFGALDIAIGGSYHDYSAGKVVSNAIASQFQMTDATVWDINAQVGWTLRGPGWGVRPALGVKFLRLTERFADPVIAGGPVSDRSRGWGIGPTVGVDASLRLTESVSVFGGVDTGFLFGRARNTLSAAVLNETTSRSRMIWTMGAKIGLDWEIAPLFHVAAGYRVNYIDGATFDILTRNPGGAIGRGGFLEHGPFIRLAYNWGAPPPGAAPAAPPAASKSFIVFFDFDRANLTPTALNTIKQAAAQAKSGRSTRIDVTGHADRSGSDAYNMALSLRRANAVKDQLVREGIAANQIVVVGRGESQPLVPTADGVREPQNRRVEIVLN